MKSDGRHGHNETERRLNEKQKEGKKWKGEGKEGLTYNIHIKTCTYHYLLCVSVDEGG